MEFNSLPLARRFIRRCGNPDLVVLVGDGGKFLVRAPADAAELIRLGYELAEDPRRDVLPLDLDEREVAL